MSILPTDMTGAITIIWFFLWMDALNLTMDEISSNCEAPLLAFLLYGSLTTIVMVGFRYLVFYLWA